MMVLLIDALDRLAIKSRWTIILGPVRTLMSAEHSQTTKCLDVFS